MWSLAAPAIDMRLTVVPTGVQAEALRTERTTVTEARRASEADAWSLAVAATAVTQHKGGVSMYRFLH